MNSLKQLHRKKADLSDRLDYKIFSTDFSLQLGKRSFLNHFSNESFYYDGTYFMLLSRENPIATISYKLSANTVDIKQIQGKKYYNNSLPKNWEKSLLVIVEDMAKEYAMKKITILNAKSIHWYWNPGLHEYHGKKLEQFRANLLLRYNGTAKKLKYKKNEKGLYEKLL